MTKTVRQALMSFLMAMVLLAMFNSASLVTWSYDLKAGAISDAMSGMAEKWDDAMGALGPAHISDGLRRWFQERADR